MDRQQAIRIINDLFPADAPYRMGIKTILTCEGCGDTLKLIGPYHIAKAEMKKAGWKNVKEGDNWIIKCHRCLNGGGK